MDISDADAAYCETYAIGGTCGHEHVEACECCTILATYFDMSFPSFLNAIVLKQLNSMMTNYDLKSIQQSMLCCDLL